MSDKLILLTGATGHVGFRVLVFALRRGYRVRAVVRNLAKTSTILATPSIQALNPGPRLTFVEIPDMVVKGAFDEALEGVDYLVHVAGPIASTTITKTPEEFEDHFIKPVVQGVLDLVESARKHDTLKRIVITSSIAALIEDASPQHFLSTVYNEETRSYNYPPPPYQLPFQAYSVAKKMALNKVEQWVKDEKPGFEVTHIIPGYVFGPNELVTDPEEMVIAGTNRIILAPVTGLNYKPNPGSAVHLDDVAEAHLRALDPDRPSNRAYLMHCGGVEGTPQLDECLQIVAKHFPDEVGKTLANNGSVMTLQTRVDASKSEELLGLKFKDYEEQVVDVVAYYLECLKKKQSIGTE